MSRKQFKCKKCQKRTHHSFVKINRVNGINYSVVKCNQCNTESSKPLLFVKKENGLRTKKQQLTIGDII